MTHEADNTNFAMSLMDDAAEAAFYASLNKVKSTSEKNCSSSEQEKRMNAGMWSNQDKVEWSCETCTFLNQPLFLSCEMCGEPRRAEDSAAEEVMEDPSAADMLTAQRQRDIMLEEEERLLKQERIKEIMALQQGIFNKIREGNEEQELDDLESSFAWMDLDEAPPMKDLSTARASMKGKDGRKPSLLDASSNTVTTAATSTFDGGSSRFSLDFSTNSQHSRLSSTRNSAIPDQALASLKEESSFNRGSFPNRHSSPNGYVDYNSLKAAVEGVSVRSFSLDGSSQAIPSRVQVGNMGGSSQHSSLVGASNHSIDLDASETRDHTRRRGALAPPLTSLTNACDDGHPQADQGNDALPSRPSLAGAVSVKGIGSSNSKSVEQRSIPRQHRSQDVPGLKPIGAVSVAGPPTTPPKEMMAGEDLALESPKPGKPPDTTPKGFFSGMHKKSQPDELDRRGSRNDGARKMPTPSMIPEEKKNCLTAPRDSVFARNLYADRKQEAAAKHKNHHRSSISGKGVGIPILGRMLRKKSVKTSNDN